jgi:dipeptidyl aminopeptidase/acylaminoacyl peptidase
MKKLTTIVALVALMLPGSVNADNDVKIGKQNIKLESDLMTPEALWAMGRIGAAEANADGSKIVYQVGYYSVKANKSQQKIAIINADGTGNTTLTTGSKSETDPTWFQGKIAFLSGGQIWTMNADGSDRKQISKTSKDIEGFKFSPDGSKVILLHSLDFNEIIKKNPEDLPKASGRLVTDLMYRHWDHYVESIQHPFVAEVTEDGIKDGIDILEGEPFECPMEPFGGIEQLAWSPDSKSIAYTCRKKTGRAYAISTDSDIYLYNIGTRETKNLCKPADYVEPELDPTKTMKYQKVNAEENLVNNVGYDQNPQFSPDGKYVAWTSMKRDGYEADRNRLCMYNLATGEKKYMTESFDSNVDAFVWAKPKDKDAQFYFIGVWHGCVNMYAVDKKGSIKQLTEDWADWVSIAHANNGNKLLAIRQSISAPNDIYIVTPGKKQTDVQQITFENKHITDQLSFGKVQQRWVKTSDGKDMLTWIILPPNFDETKKYPTLLFCEGGPQSPVSQFWSYRWNFFIMAANGYVVVAPNRHGLPGFGQEWKEEVSGDWTGQCMKDYLSAIDFAADSLPFVDRERLGAVGASFGGFSVYYLAGIHEKRFKAFIAHDGAFNLAAMYLETEENWFSNWEYDEAYWHRPQMPRAKTTYHESPHKMVEKWDTPILCIHGEKDYRINYTQGMAAFNAARMKGIPAEFLVFPDENHWVLKPQNGILWQRTFFGWLDRWLK